MKHFAKGLLYGLAFFLPGAYLFTYGNLPDISPYFDLPIIRELTNKYQTEVDLSSDAFLRGVNRFLNKSNNIVNNSAFYDNKNAAWTWKRADLEAKLKQELGAKQVERRQLFLDYIEQYAPLALSEMAQSRIPASVTLAQGILETRAGDSYIARAARNHFGIKCYRKPNFKADGHIDDNDFYHHSLAYDCLQIADDNVWDRFQVYETVNQSYRHHSLLLQERRYNWMIAQYSSKIGQQCQVEGSWFNTDRVPYYAAWCIGLKKSGYATSKKYAQKLTYIIETYELWRFDYQLIMGIN
ncbi:MAG: glucosaminidase domain-containing protein [Saprospiraceae bacterium]